MTAKNQNFDIHAGNSKNLVISVTKPVLNTATKKIEQRPVDLTGCSAEWVLNDGESDNTDILVKTTADDIVITDPVNGKLVVRIRPADTTGMLGTYHHELEITDPGLNVSTVLIGTCVIR